MPSLSRRNTDDPTPRLDRCGGRLVPVARDRLRADPVAPAARALRLAVAAHGRRPARALIVARRVEHDRELVRSRDLPACDPRRRRRALHPRRAAALLDRDLAPLGPEHDPRSAAGPARAAAAGGLTAR